MNDSNNSAVKLTRRDVLKNAIALVGGSITASQLGLLSHAWAAAKSPTPRFLDDSQLALVKRAVDIIIPSTDTPGAAEAGVHRFIDMMMADWASEGSRDTMTRAIADIDVSARQAFDRPFIDLQKDQQQALLETIDDDTRGKSDSQSPFGMFKQLTIYGYYTSEIGASVEAQVQSSPRGVPWLRTSRGRRSVLVQTLGHVTDDQSDIRFRRNRGRLRHVGRVGGEGAYGARPASAACWSAAATSSTEGLRHGVNGRPGRRRIVEGRGDRRSARGAPVPPDQVPGLLGYHDAVVREG